MSHLQMTCVLSREIYFLAGGGRAWGGARPGRILLSGPSEAVQKAPLDCVIPAEAGIHNLLFFMDSCFRRNDDSRNFSRFLDTLSELKSAEADWVGGAGR